MTDTFRNLKESYKLYNCYRKLYRKGLLNKLYTFEEVYNCYKKNREVVING